MVVELVLGRITPEMEFAKNPELLATLFNKILLLNVSGLNPAVAGLLNINVDRSSLCMVYPAVTGRELGYEKMLDCDKLMLSTPFYSNLDSRVFSKLPISMSDYYCFEPVAWILTGLLDTCESFSPS